MLLDNLDYVEKFEHLGKMKTDKINKLTIFSTQGQKIDMG